MEIAINLPNDFVALQPIKDIEHDMRLSYALWLFKNAKVTLSKAAELATLDIYDFLAECKKNEVPVINVSREDLLGELAATQNNAGLALKAFLKKYQTEKIDIDTRIFDEDRKTSVDRDFRL